METLTHEETVKVTYYPSAGFRDLLSMPLDLLGFLLGR